jgi:nucleoside 2-deoxyribosyltransferase
MKIYFAGSIRGGREDQPLYFEIIEYLQKFGEVLTEHLGNKSLSSDGEKRPSEDIYQRDVDWVEEADVIVAEVTTPSLGVGYEIGIAEKLGKKILCLYRHGEDRRLSAMIDGNSSLEVVYYKDLEGVKSKIDEFFYLSVT